MSKENIQTKLICLKDSGLSFDECQFTGRLEFHDTNSIANLVSNITCAEIMATEVFLNFDNEIDEFFLFSLFTDTQIKFSALKKITVAKTNQYYNPAAADPGLPCGAPDPVRLHLPFGAPPAGLRS